jgi:hypothetical protein
MTIGVHSPVVTIFFAEGHALTALTALTATLFHLRREMASEIAFRKLSTPAAIFPKIFSLSSD